MRKGQRRIAKLKNERKWLAGRKHDYQKAVELTECEDCGEMDINKLTRHHKIHQSQGGSDDPENIEVLCEDCHEKKH